MARLSCAFAVLFICVSTALAATTPSPQEKISVTVYYESLCPDSKKFIFEQLKPVYSNFSNYLNLTLVPFGLSTYNRTAEGKYEFMCHHGEPECHGNKVQACALKLLQPGVQVDYITCLMKTANNNTNSSMPYPGVNCSHLVGVDYTKIEACEQGDQGSELLAALGDKTIGFQNPLQHVPTIVFNDKYVMEEDELAKNDFKTSLCNKFTGSKPAECGAKGSAVSLNSGYLPIVIISAVTVLSRY